MDWIKNKLAKLKLPKLPKLSLNKISTKTALIIICVLLAVLLIALTVLVLSVKGVLGNVGRLDGSETLSPEQLESILNATDDTVDPSAPVFNAGDVTRPSEPAEVIDSEDTINILLVGQDRRQGEGRRHSDSMVLCTLNKTTKTLTMTSFLRDLWVPIPGYYDERLNVPYMIKGFSLLNDTLEYNFGVRADYNIEVDFDGFEAVIDTVGGIDLYLTSAEAKYLNKNGNWNAGDTYTGSWNLTKGINHMTGIQALAYSRIRDLDSDFGRTDRQRKVLTTLLEKVESLSLTEIYKLVQTVAPLVSTDMTDSQILGLAIELAPMLSDLKVVSQRIPADGAFSDAAIDDDGVIKRVLLMDEEDREKNIQLLKDSLGQN